MMTSLVLIMQMECLAMLVTPPQATFNNRARVEMWRQLFSEKQKEWWRHSCVDQADRMSGHTSDATTGNFQQQTQGINR